MRVALPVVPHPGRGRADGRLLPELRVTLAHRPIIPRTVRSPLLIITMANTLRLALIAALLLMFSQTAGAILQTAQTLDRVTADKVAQIEALGR